MVPVLTPPPALRLPPAIRMGVALEIEQQRDALAIRLQNLTREHYAMMGLFWMALHKKGPLYVRRLDMEQAPSASEQVIERIVSPFDGAVVWKAKDLRDASIPEARVMEPEPPQNPSVVLPFPAQPERV